MHPITQYELMQARTADRACRAERSQIALATRQARRRRDASPRGDLVRRLLRVLGDWQPSRDNVS